MSIQYDETTGHFDEDDIEELAIQLWDVGLVRPESLGREVVEEIGRSDAVREMLSQVWIDAIRHVRDTAHANPNAPMEQVSVIAENANPYLDDDHSGARETGF